MKKRECQYRSDCRSWTWSSGHTKPPYACYLTNDDFDTGILQKSKFSISAPRNCTDFNLLEGGNEHQVIPNSCIMKSNLVGYEEGEAFDDFSELNLLHEQKPLSKMVFWRYTCARPCLGTAQVPGRNGHVTSFITKYGDTKSKFHGYPLLGGTKTAIRSFFNFTNEEKVEDQTPDRIRKVEVAFSAPPWGAVSMMKVVSQGNNQELKYNYVGFIKWLNSGFLELNPPDMVI